MIAMSLKTFIIKVLAFINIYLLSFTRMEGDTHIKCSCKDYIIRTVLKQANNLKFKNNFLKFILYLLLLPINYDKSYSTFLQAPLENQLESFEL